MADQIVTITMSAPFADGTQDNKITISWTSATGGAVSCDIAATFAAAQAPNGPKPKKLKGFIARVVTNPGATAPTDDYDIALNDEDGVDVMATTLNNRDTATSEQVIPSDPPFIDGELSLAITAAGDEKTGEIVIYMIK